MLNPKTTETMTKVEKLQKYYAVIEAIIELQNTVHNSPLLMAVMDEINSKVYDLNSCKQDKYYCES